MLEFQLTRNSISAMHIWLAALLGVSFLLTVVFLLHLVSPRLVPASKFYRFGKVLLAVLASLQILAWQIYLFSSSHDTVALWCFPIALFGGAVVWRLSNGSPTLSPLRIRTLPAAIFLLSLFVLAGFAQATKQFSESCLLDGDSELIANVNIPGKLVERTTIYGTTDRGSPIKLFERQITTDAFNDYVQRCRKLLATLSERAMLRAHPFVQSNCHGWVFTDGQHILRGEDVQVILDENYYTEVSNPQSNDVVVYRGNDGKIIHTGVVRGSLEGSTIVESKWGIGALYMHVAEEQPYSQHITYYRTNRPTHLIAIATSKPSDELLSDQAVDNSVQRSAFNTHFCSSESK